MQKTDAEEIKQHQKVWERRGSLTRNIEKVFTEINEKVEEVIEDAKVKERHSARVAGNVAYIHDLKTSKGN
jgi:macrodomain Ter protein organizer (MatP/YcbG family)